MRNPQIQQRMNPLHNEGMPYCRRYECKSPSEPFALGGAIVLREILVRASFGRRLSAHTIVISIAYWHAMLTFRARRLLRINTWTASLTKNSGGKV